jgi:hypothetical protein
MGEGCYRDDMMENRAGSGVRLLAITCVASAACMLAACKGEKPNATRDMRKNQSQYMDEMDKIAERLKEEEKAKTAKTSGTSPGAPSEASPAPEPESPEAPAKPDSPAKTKDPG